MNENHLKEIDEAASRLKLEGARIAFFREVSNPAETRKVLVEMVQQARSQV